LVPLTDSNLSQQQLPGRLDGKIKGVLKKSTKVDFNRLLWFILENFNFLAFLIPATFKRKAGP
jgi:hypothetical protein